MRRCTFFQWAVVLVLCSTGCRSARDDVEALLGTSLPSGRDVEIHRVRPSPDLAATVWYVRFPTTAAEHSDFTRQARLRPDDLAQLLHSSLGEPPPSWAALPAGPQRTLGRIATADYATTSFSALHFDGYTYLMVERVPRASPGPW